MSDPDTKPLLEWLTKERATLNGLVNDVEAELGRVERESNGSRSLANDQWWAAWHRREHLVHETKAISTVIRRIERQNP